MIAELSNKQPGTLTAGLNCPACKNRGYFHRVDEDGRRYTEECSCMVKRRSAERLQRSGLSDMVSRYTLENWKTPEPWQVKARDIALRYAEERTGWFVMTGTVGGGKTHLCTAVCGLLLERGLDVRYMMWREVSVRVKAVVNDECAYRQLVEPLKRAKVLYIDDLFKTGGSQPTTGDINLAFELLNARYNDSALLTIISTEHSISNLMTIDEAVGSRIYERSKGYNLNLTGKQNWRLRRE